MRRGETSRLWRSDTIGQIQLFRRASWTSHSTGTATTPTSTATDQPVVGVIGRDIEGDHCRGERVVAPAGHLKAANSGEVCTGYPAREHSWTYRMFYSGISLVAEVLVAEVTTELFGPGRQSLFAQPVIRDPSCVLVLLSVPSLLEGTGDRLEAEASAIDASREPPVRHMVDGLLLERSPTGLMAAAARAALHDRLHRTRHRRFRRPAPPDPGVQPVLQRHSCRCHTSRLFLVQDPAQWSAHAAATPEEVPARCCSPVPLSPW